MRVNNITNLEQVSPERCPEYPGFYYHPDNRQLLVSRDGVFINLKTGKILKPNLHKSGRFMIVFTSGERINGKYKAYNFKVHRALARVFIGRPSRHLDKPFSKLEVNHIDGNPQNNNLSNLEWVTGVENNWHAHKTGLHPKDRPVIARSIIKESSIFFNSVEACAFHFGISKPTLWKHLTSGNSGRFHKKGYIFKFNDDSEWNLLPVPVVKEIGNSIKVHDFKITELKTGIVTIVSGLQSLVNYMNKSCATLCRYFKKNIAFSGSEFFIEKI